MKKNNKGFIFVETIIVIAFLATSLIIIYKSFNNLLTNEKRRLYYDDPLYLYRTYYVLDFLESHNITAFIERELSENVAGPDNKLLTEFVCQDSLILQKSEERAWCENLVSQYSIKHIYFGYFDTTPLASCTSESGVTCGMQNSLKGISLNALLYIRTLGGKDKEGYRVIIEYEAKMDKKVDNTTVEEKNSKNHNVTTEPDTKYFYATLFVPFGE